MKLVAYILYATQSLYKLLYNLPLLGSFFDIYTATLASALNFTSGRFAAPGHDKSKRPEKMLKLYVYDGCPFCRKVVETISVLALDVLVYPCPRVTLRRYGEVKDSRYREEAVKLGGLAKFPLLIDENVEPPVIYESEDIIRHLWENYGDKAQKPMSYSMARYFQVAVQEGFLRNLFRPLNEQGTLRIPSKPVEEPLVLWGYEGSPFVLRVKELLCSLELPYIYRTVPMLAEQKRKDYMRKYGSMLSSARKTTNLIQVPLLVDPNNKNAVLLESADIMKYLKKNYQIGAVTKESMLDYTTEGAKEGHATIS